MIDFLKLQKSIQQLDHNSIKAFEETGTLQIASHTCKNDDILIYRESLPNSNTYTNRLISIVIDHTLDDKLLAEGSAREMINRIQNLRKEENFQLADRISINIDCNKELADILTTHQTYIQQETLCRQWQFTKIDTKNSHAHTIIIDRHKAILQIKKTKP